MLNHSLITAQRVFCVGMNYTEHINELGSATPEEPVIFMKPAHSIAQAGKQLSFPAHGHELHFETELVVLIGKEGYVKNISDALGFIQGLTLGFDLTLRDVQARLKKSGHPWETAKAFEDSAPLGNFIEMNSSIDIHNLEFLGKVNGHVRQRGNTSQMIFSLERLISYIGGIWRFLPGDIIFTGTPPGVGSLKKSDKITAYCPALEIDTTWKFH